ncbi:putative nucleotide-binding protein [Salmonella enterica]|nr:putative nucleotide-binding protein [Salmonella enterica]
MTGKSRDDLQSVMALVRGGDLGQPFQFKTSAIKLLCRIEPHRHPAILHSSFADKLFNFKAIGHFAVYFDVSGVLCRHDQRFAYAFHCQQSLF